MDNIPTPQLTEMCRKESERYRRGRSGGRGYCYELFRRAIVDRNQEAWTAIYKQYRRLVGKWVGGPADRIEERVNQAFAKFWRAVNPDSFCNRFSTIGKVMTYLQMCARSVRTDEHRRRERHQMLTSLNEATASTGNPMSKHVIDNIVRQELFAYIEQQLNDEEERVVIHLSFKVGLAPRQIAQERPDVFADAAAVRRAKERVVRRLSNDLRLQNWWKSQTPLSKSD